MRAHSIPVGGDEPIHEASNGCWCFPVADSCGLTVHNAQDCREVLERQGRKTPGRMWVMVSESVVERSAVVVPAQEQDQQE